MGWRQISGPVITVAVLLALEFLSTTTFRISSPAPIYLTAVVYASLVGGARIGLLSAATTVAYALYVFWIPGHVPAASFTRVVVLALTTSVTAMMVGHLRQDLLDQLERRRRTERRTESLAEVARLLSQSLEPREVAQRIAESVRELLRVQATAVFTLRPEARELVQLALSGDLAQALGTDLVLPEGAGVAGLAVAERRGVATVDVLDDPRIRHAPESRRRLAEARFRSALAVPLTVKERVIGAVSLWDQRRRVFAPDEIALVEAFASHAAAALENARLYAEAERQRNEAELFAEVTQTINASLDVNTVLQRITEVAREICRGDLAHISLREPGSEAVTVRYRAGSRYEGWGAVPVDPGKGSGGIVLRTGRPFRTSDYLNDPRITMDYTTPVAAEGIVAQIVVPILRDGRVAGLIYVSNRTPRPFTEGDERNLLRLTNDAAIALSNAELFSREQAARREAEASEGRYRGLFDGVPVGLFRATSSGRILAVNPAFVTIFGYPDMETLLGTNAVELYPAPEDRRSLLARLERNDLVRGEEVRRRRFGGAIIWIRHTVRAIRNDEGRLVGLEGTVEDITERKQAEAALFHSTERLRILQEIDRAIVAARSPREIATVALHHLRRLVPCARAGVIMFDLDLHEATALATTAPGDGPAPAEYAPVKVFGDIEHLRHEFLSLPELRTADGPAAPSRITMPLVADNEPIGALRLVAESRAAFTPEHLDVVREVARPLAIAIRQAHLHETVTAARRRLEGLSRRLVDVQEAERRHLARELHDEVGQLLTGLKLSLGAAGRSANPALRARLTESRGLVGSLMARVRELSLDLRPPMLDDLGLVPALVWQFERYTAQTKVEVLFKHAGVDGRRFGGATETAAYRIVQEALTNVARHARVAEVTVRLWADDKTLTAQIEDHGIGLTTRRHATHRGQGLAGMMERAALVGGGLALEPAEEGGLRVTAELPVNGTAAPEEGE